jgi:acyl-coenzyme A synthetase/AMP-(fatty) acid ligase
MLYGRWRQIVCEHRHELALCDLASGQSWTFGQLDAAVEATVATADSILFPQGISADFVFTVLRAWRAGKVTCPLEAGQTAPDFSRLPSGSVHLKTTSATTDVPRLIAFTAEQLAADAENIVATMGLRPDWPNLGVISLAHSYGFSNLVTPLLLHGVPLILADSPLPETVLHAAKTVENITLPAVPALWRAWHEAKAIPSNVRLAISAGAPLPLPLELAVFEATAIKLHNFYGASECGGIAYDASTGPRADATCVGAPLRNVQLTVNEEGCLEVRSRAVGENYWPAPSPDLSPGCYRTSDLAELRDGLVFLRGRSSDLINVAGRKVSPESIERALLTHPAVGECLVFGAPSDEAERSEIIVACVAVRSGAAADGLRQFLLAKLPAWQVPRQWVFVESLPTNQRGKLSRAEWRRRLLERSPSC